MFKWTTTSFVNGANYLDGDPSWFLVKEGNITYSDANTSLPTTTTNEDEVSFTVNRNVKFFKDNITSITKAKWSLPEYGEMTIDFSKANLEVGDYRFYLYIRAIGNADPLYANDLIYKGRPVYIEFAVKDTDASKIAGSFVKTAKRWISLLYANQNIIKVSANGTKVTIKAINEFQRFFVAEIQKYDSEALTWAHDGAFVTLFSSDEDEDVFEITSKGKPGFGTYTDLIQNLRLPTNANTRFFRHQENEMPLVTGKYWQYVITQCTERPEMQGTSVLGQYNKSITTHVIFVEDGVQSAFNSALANLGVTITEVNVPKNQPSEDSGDSGNDNSGNANSGNSENDNPIVEP